MQFIIAAMVAFNSTFFYVELPDITDSTNNWENLRNTVELCYSINDTEKAIRECTDYALLRATTIHV